MRIFFIGCVQFSHLALQKLLSLQNQNLQIVGIATKEKSNFNGDFYDLKQDALNIPCIYSKDINDENTAQFIKACEPDIIYCLGWSFLIKKELLSLYPVIGFHPSKLPQNRGRHPIIWALFLGLKESGVSFFVMNERADEGRILRQKIVQISHKDNASSLYKKITQIALKELEILTRILVKKSFHQKNYKAILHKISSPQGKGNAWRKREFKDGVIDFRMSSEAIYNLVRALAPPYATATVYYKNEAYKIYKAQIVPNLQKNLECGKILKVSEKGILVKTYDSSILLSEHNFKNLPKVGEYF